MADKQKLILATDQRPFIMIYQDFLESRLLSTSNEKMLFIALKKFADKNNQCFPSLKKLADISGMSKKTVQRTLKILEEKKVISILNREREDGGQTSNLYKLYDIKELWDVGSVDDVPAIIDAFEEQRMIEALTKKGYIISKEKGLASKTGQSNGASTHLNLNSLCNNIISENEKSQEPERYSMQDICDIFEYATMIHDYPDRKKDIDAVMETLYITMNTTGKTIRVAGSDLPAMVVIGKLMKLTPESILYAIRKYNEQTGRIQNPTAYMLTLLYRANEQFHFDINNQVRHDLFGE